MQENIYTEKISVEKYFLSRNIPDEILEEYAGYILNILGKNNGKIIDVGCGTGMVFIPLCTLSKNKEVFGLDHSFEMIKKTGEKLINLGFGEMNLICGDIRNYSELFEESFDIAHIKAITHIPENPKAFLDKIIKIIKPSGFLVIGKEYSQPEDNLERILNYGKNGEQENEKLKSFYEYYFSLRQKIGKIFHTPEMPAGDYENAKRYLLGKGLSFVKEVETNHWTKKLSFGEIIDAISNGTFTVFRKGLSEQEMKKLGISMVDYCKEKNINIEEEVGYGACMKLIILKK